MNPYTDKPKFPKTDFSVGSILIAQPSQLIRGEPIFRRSVILIIEHTDSGTKGIILNKKTNCFVDQFVNTAGTEINTPVYYGGPESIDMLMFLHNLRSIPYSAPCARGIFYNGDPLYIQENIQRRVLDLRRIKFYLGYVQWGHGELESQIAKNQWWVSEISPVLLFSERPEDLWSIRLQQQGHLLSQFAEIFDPSLN